ncbi:uncharacterized protein LOC128857197 [Anastrepha ludens]|uniref:uncharacterized protein LOC128857197 n=1 Tax=Anastrepha ludens TaxID=28586 RepID=UPI0023B00FCC|nr:uncharacterized protein LOC128857197 [Anastrepha ludens]
MTFTSRTTHSANPHRYGKSRWRQRPIIAFVAIIGMLILVLMFGRAFSMLMKSKDNNNNSNWNLENNSSDTSDTHLVSSVEIMLLTNEFAATINTNTDSNQINNNNSSYVRRLYEINTADEDSGSNAATVNGHNNNLLATPPVPHQKRFDDEINMSNQRNEFNERPTAAIAVTAPKRPAASLSIKDNSDAASLPAASFSSSTAIKPLESVGMEYEIGWQQQQPQQQQQGRSQQHNENTELVHHRQKRYLIFPEGSSFQLVFDLIIGMVDFTNYLILGITCAVAWELPSKPPSELIENLHDKVTEGIYSTSEARPTGAASTAMRRNDSTVIANGSDGKYGWNAAGIKYVDNANVDTYAESSYENRLQSQVVTALPQPPPSPVLTPLNTMEAAYFPQIHQRNPFASPTTTGTNGYQKGSPDTRYYTDADTAYRPTNYYTNSHSNNYYNNKNTYYKPSYKHSVADKTDESSYYGVSDSSSKSKSNNRKAFGYSAHDDLIDKQPVKFANRWWQQENQQLQPHKKWPSWQNYDSNWQPYQQQKQKHAKWAHQQQKWAHSTHSKYAGTDNWWLRNKQKGVNSWREGRARIPAVSSQTQHLPVMTFTPPSESLRHTDTTISPKADVVDGRNFGGAQRRLLTTRPKAKIYPVFRRRRRRRRSSDTQLDDFELKLERIHLREQLRTRQKLYGKIEKLYQTRGLNGTACVLRALCETGQQHQNAHDDKAEPQSFITELLRSIFVLPTININSSTGDSVKFEESALHPTDLHIVDRPYREAQAHRGSCAQLFAMCDHSIWE